MARELQLVQYNKSIMAMESEIPKSFKPISSCLSEGVERPCVRCDYKNPPITYKSSM